MLIKSDEVCELSLPSQVFSAHTSDNHFLYTLLINFMPIQLHIHESIYYTYFKTSHYIYCYTCKKNVNDVVNKHLCLYWVIPLIFLIFFQKATRFYLLIV